NNSKVLEEFRGGLVVRSRIRDQKVPGFKPDSTEDLLCLWVCCTLNLLLRVKRPLAVVVQKFGQGVLFLVIRPRGLTLIQNYQVCPQTGHVLLQNGA
ncbi:hypothetical protein AVEN_207532-1, partial [Araneus ventricosus]